MAHGIDDAAISEDFEEMSLVDSELEARKADVQFWERYLRGLRHQSRQETNVKNLDLCYDLSGTLVESFIDRLMDQHDAKMKEKNDAVATAKENLKGFVSPWIPLRYVQVGNVWIPNHSLRYVEVENVITRWEQLRDELKTAEGIHSDRERSGSTWTVKMLAKYVRREDVELYAYARPWEFDKERRKQLPLDIDRVSDEIMNKITVMGDQLTTECDTRMVLDAILHPICFTEMCMGVTMRTEQTFKHESLPNNRCDYVLYHKNSPIGIVEAKRPGSLIDKSVVQLILQLLSLSAQNPTRPYFGLIYDVKSYFLAFVNKEKVFLPELDNGVAHSCKIKEMCVLLLTIIYNTMKGVCVPTAMCTKSYFMFI